MKHTLQTVLDRSIDDVWRAFTNPENVPRWMPSLKSLEVKDGQGGEPGSVARMVFLENGRELVIDETVLTRREPFEFSARFDNQHGSNVVTNRFESQSGGQTLWTLDAYFTFRGFLTRLLMPLFKGLFRKRLHDDCMRFKEKLESGALIT